MSEVPGLPRWLRDLLDWIDPSLRDDIGEEYQAMGSRGRWFEARLWYWSEVVRSAASGTWRRAWNSTLGTMESHHVRRYGMLGALGVIAGGLVSDIRLALRGLARTPGVALLAVLTMGLGVGLTTQTFSFVYGSTIRGMPVRDADRFVRLHRVAPNGDQEWHPAGDYLVIRERLHSFEYVGAFTSGTVNVAGVEAPPERYLGAWVTPAGFDQLGIRPALGRAFDHADAGAGAALVAVIGYPVWQNRYAGASDVVGRSLRINGREHTIIGVMPRGFGFPFDQDMWLPLRVDETAVPGRGAAMALYGHIREGVSREQALSEAQNLAAELAASYPDGAEEFGATIRPFVEDYMPAEIVAVNWVALASSFGVLLIACANVANLLFARALGRSREVAVRTALGASRLRILRQFLSESVVLALLGGAAGVVWSFAAANRMDRVIADIQKPWWIDVRPDLQSLSFALIVTAVAAVGAGLAPALRASRGNVHELLKAGSRTSSGGVGRLTTVLVTGQVAVSCALLVGAGLLIKSIVNSKNLEPGFETANIMTGRVGLMAADYPDAAARRRLFRNLEERLSALPGARSAALASALPGLGAWRMLVEIEGQSYATLRDRPSAHAYVVTAGFFETFGMRPLEGRTIGAADQDSAMPAAVVSRSFATRHFPGGALGSRLRLSAGENEPWRTVVGVVPDTEVGGGVGGIGNDQLRPEQVYIPATQFDATFMSFAIRTESDPTALLPSIRGTVTGLDRNLPVYFAQTMDAALDQSMWAFPLFGRVFTMFGLMSLFLAAVGLYGVMDSSVRRRTREMGIRMALGATRGTIIRTVMGRGIDQLVLGLGIGMLIGYGMGRPLEFVLYRVDAGDPLVFALIFATLSVTGVLACLVPARRATRVSPVEVLQDE